MAANARRVAVCTALLLSLSTVGGVSAGELQTVTLIDLSPDERAAREITHDVARALKRMKDIHYRSVDESLNIGGEDMQRNNVRSAASLLRNGKKKLNAGDFDDAAEELESAVTGLMNAFAHSPDQQLVVDVFIYSGVALVKSNQRKLAVQAFERAVTYHPKRRVDLSKWGSAVEKAYQKARDKVLLRDQVTWELRTEPANAEVWVNGRYFGLSPTFVRTFKGAQFVRLYKAGMAREGRVLTVNSENKVVNVKLRSASRKPAYDTLLERFSEVFDGAVEPNDFSEAQGLLVAPRAVLVHNSGTREKMTVQLAYANLSGRQVVKRVTRNIKWLRRDKKAIERLVQELFKAPDIPMVAPQEVRTDSVFRKWWFWTAVGVVAAGATTGAILLSRTSEVPDEYAPGQGGLEIRF